jgi:solute carrier family 6 (neurotransmitter transporter)
MCFTCFTEAEPMSTAQFLRAVEPQRGGEQVSPMPTRLVPHSSMLAGQRLVLPISSRRSRRSLSGYQAIRLATELLPATFAALGISQLSVFWAILAYFSLILFGIAQQVSQ